MSAPPSAATVKPTDPKNPSTQSNFSPLKVMAERHHPYIVELVASEASVEPESIIDFELVLFDTQKACLGGLLNEFIFSARLDNLNMSFCAVQGLISSLKLDSALDNDSTIRLISLFDHEEIGSLTAQGADSNMLPVVIRRLSVLPPVSSSRASISSTSDSEKSYDKTSAHSGPDISTAFEQTLSTSFLLSADMAHSVNPNFAFKYENDHKPEMNKGPVIKINANARYATNSPGIALLQEVARRAISPTHSSTSNSTTSNTGEDTDSNGAGVPLQLFVVRNDSSCGSTIGPMVSAKLGARTLDLGNPQLSMHSIRETGGTQDVHYAIRLFSSFFENYGVLESKILVD
jgi:aspartyl aminopeptidase